MKENDELVGYLTLNDYEVPLNDLTFKNNNMSFYLLLEGAEIAFNITFNKKSFKGTASYFEGEVEITGKKE